MTLDEAIIHAEEVANSRCDECANEHKQLAEWLKDYKRLLEQEPCEDCIDRADAMTEIMMFAGNKKHDDDIYIKVSDVVELIRELPSVNPEIPVSLD